MDGYHIEPQIILYYKKTLYTHKANKLYNYFNGWKLYSNDQKISISYVARQNYRQFHVMDYLPSYSVVDKSSAGIRGWAKAGPFKTIGQFV